METCIDTIENDIRDVPTAEIGSVAAPREITVIPVPYAGSEQPIVITRPAVDEFMATLPA